MIRGGFLKRKFDSRPFPVHACAMIIKITFKNPDAIDTALADHGVTSPEKKAEYQKVFDKFFEYGEYVTIQIDTRTGTATVVPL